MKTELLLGETLKKLMSTEPLDKITVKRLTEVCGINRQTFYYHYRDIFDLLTWVYLNESIAGLEEAKSWREALRMFFDYISKNSKFTQNTLSSAGRQLFIEFLYNMAFTVHMSNLSRLDTRGILTSEEKKFIASFYSPSFVFVIVRWVDAGMKENTETLIDRIDTVTGPYISEAIEKFARKKAPFKHG
jgi:AcrR family transcriptional regulator